MAKINPVKVKQEADKLEKAGRLDQAILLYRQIVDDNPRDWNTINKIGDLLAKMGRVREAGEEYAKVADFYAKDGFLLKAIAIWKKINKLDASALEPYLNLGELYAKQGLMMEAKSQYQVVVDEYIRRNKMRDAGDVLKKMADIDPGDLKVRSKLADLYTREGNPARAIEEHVAIADELSRKGHLAEAVQVLEKGLKIDPGSNRLRVELAKLHLGQKAFEKAVPYLEEAVRQQPGDSGTLARLGEAYLGARKIEEAEAIFKRLLEIDPQDEESRIQIGRVYLMQGNPDRAFQEFGQLVDKLVERREGDKAASLLQQIVQREPAHVKSLIKLAEIYRLLHKDSAVSTTYSQLVEAYLKQGDLEQAASILEIMVGREPQNQQHRSKLDFVRSKLTAAAPGPSQDVLDEEFEIAPVEPVAEPVRPARPALHEQFRPEAEPPAAARSVGPGPAPAAAPAAGLQRPEIELSGPLTPEDREFVEEHLAEGKVFRKYGLVDKAADQFESVVARFPDNADARVELREVFKEKGQNLKAAAQCLALAEIARLKGDVGAAEAHEAEAQALAPEAFPEPVAEVEVEPPAAESRLDETPEEAFVDDDLAGAGLEAVAIDDGEEHEIPLDIDEGLETPTGSPEEAGDALPSVAVEARPAFEEAPEELADEIPPAFLDDGTPSTDSVVGFPGGVEGELDEVAGFEESTTPEEQPSLESVAAPELALSEGPSDASPAFEEGESLGGATAVAEPAPEDVPSELRRVLAEVDDYLSLGFVDDAREALREVGRGYPDHPALVAKLRELGLEMFEEPSEALLVPEPPLEPPLEISAPPQLQAEGPSDGLGDLEPSVEQPVEGAGESPESLLDLPSADLPSASGPAGAESAEALLELAGADSGLLEPQAASSGPDALSDIDFGSAGTSAVEPEPAGLGLDLAAGEAEAGSPLDGLAAAGAAEDLSDLGLGEPPPAPLEELTPSLGGELDLPDLATEAPLPEPTPFGTSVAPPLLDEPVPEPAPVAASEEAGLDLGRELQDLFGTVATAEEDAPAASASPLGDAGLADIFKEFKKGVDRQLSREDYDTRYNLGIAYKEMGLLDEAIAEFQLAAKDETRILECSSMLGICFLEKGMPKLAVKWFEKGLAVPGRSEDEYSGIRYDLAVAHEAAGDTEAALGLFTDLYGQDANFRDVAQKIRELRGGA